MSEDKQNQIVKDYVLANLEPCTVCLVKTCCTQICDELFEVQNENTYKINENLNITFGEDCILKDEIIDA